MIDNCLWGNKQTNGDQWIRRAAFARGAPLGPTVDGSNNSKGHYLVVNLDERVGIKADLTSNTTALNQLKRAFFTCRMTFQYYMSANSGRKDSTYFSINVGSNSYFTRTVWRMTGQVLNKWINASAAIGDQVYIT